MYVWHDITSHTCTRVHLGAVSTNAHLLIPPSPLYLEKVLTVRKVAAAGGIIVIVIMIMIISDIIHKGVFSYRIDMT